MKYFLVTLSIITIILLPIDSKYFTIRADTGYIDPNANGTVASTPSTGTNYETVNDGERQPNTAGLDSENNNFINVSGDFYQMSTISSISSVSQITIWAYYNGSKSNMYFDVGLYGSDETTQYGTTQRLTQQTTNGWSSVTFSGLSLTQAQLNDLRVQFYCLKVGSGGPGTCNLSSFYGDVTYTGVTISVAVSDGTISYGNINLGNMGDTTSGGINDSQTATNDGSGTEDFNIKGQNSTSWTLAGSSGSEQYIHEFCTTTCDSTPVWNNLTTSYQTLSTGVVTSGNQIFDLRITVPTGTADYTQQSVDVTVQAVASP